MIDSAVSGLIEELGRFPGVGPKSAQRIALFIIQNPTYDPTPLLDLLARVRTEVSFCEVCGMLNSEQTCSLCEDKARDESVLCVVEEVKDVWAIERTGAFRGKYHVLGGALSPIDGVGPDSLRIRELMQRVSDHSVTEVILAMDPNLEGEATASYLMRLLVQPGLSVTRLASGLPVGGDLEYADEITLARAIAHRTAS
jgi:recombination protein RecR